MSHLTNLNKLFFTSNLHLAFTMQCSLSCIIFKWFKNALEHHMFYCKANPPAKFWQKHKDESLFYKDKLSHSPVVYKTRKNSNGLIFFVSVILNLNSSHIIIIVNVNRCSLFLLYTRGTHQIIEVVMHKKFSKMSLPLCQKKQTTRWFRKKTTTHNGALYQSCCFDLRIPMEPPIWLKIGSFDPLK